MSKRRFVFRTVRGTLRHILRAILYGLAGGTLVLLIGFVRYLEGRPDLSVWHSADLDEEFTADSPVSDFAGYRALEDRLFAQVEERVYERSARASAHEIDRFRRGSLADPERWKTDWNRSFEWESPRARAGVLLLHGLSDSPYSLRALGRDLHRAGTWVVGLRLPGHGTAPVGLAGVAWEDWAAAVKLGMRRLRDRVGGAPIYIVGYSNGGALALEYALSALSDRGLPEPAGLVLLSPEIGISRLAALAVWQERLGHVLGLEKLAWSSILPEYDPFKYISFALNAAQQAYRLTGEIQAQLTALASRGLLERLPPILAFQSVADATVSAPALVNGLFDRLPAGPYELVIFDINRFTEIEPVLKGDPSRWLHAMFGDAAPSFSVTLVANASEQSERVVSRTKHPGDPAIALRELGLAWPPGVYSLSHVALPFPPDDPLYGDGSVASPGIQLGNLALRGERGVLRIAAADLVRLRWNPFYSYLSERVLDFTGLADGE